MVGPIASHDEWRIAPPDDWPSAPEEMSFSTWLRIAACPRQWALSNARYAHLSATYGYPECANFAALRGWVVHRALSEVTGALVANGCGGISDARAITVLRELGGFTAVITRAIDAAMARTTGNFRMQAQAASVNLKFIRELPILREKLQLLLSQVRWASIRQKNLNSRPAAVQKNGLGPGVYHEMPLRARTLGWRGIADLVEVSNTHVTITEFKTGSHKEDHNHQLHTYSVLWRLDEQINPSGRVADRLQLSYPGKTISVSPLNFDEVQVLEAELFAKAARARADCTQSPPKANLGHNTCPLCPVRQLCDEYWSSGAIVAADSSDDHYIDCELTITAARSAWSWDTTLQRVPGRKDLVLPQNCVLYARHREAVSGAPILIGGAYRLLNCRFETGDDNSQTSFVEITHASEVFGL
jgi:PD-(D/E)XK nuclease superfamily